MTYDRQILEILADVGKRGISVRVLARHVYSMNRTFFSSPDFNDVYVYVQRYLLRNSKSAQPLVESTGRRGYYRLSTRNSADVQQMMLKFMEEDDVKEEKNSRQDDLSLDLFA